ncbi:hypothetical protein V8C37DRAFT_411732 [Trichoderma ceciliae]
MTDERKPTDLFLAISHAAMRRQQEGMQQREEQQDLNREWEEEHVLKPQKIREDEEKAKEKTKQLVTEMFKEELKVWREQRDKEARWNHLSRAEVDEEVLRMVEEVHRMVGLGKRRMEDGTEEPHKKWRGRMVDLRTQIYRVWNENQGRIGMGLPRYVEGYPVREGIEPPKFLPGRRQEMSGLGVCLQCEVKGLGCSRSVLSRGVSGRELKGKGCKRCEDAGNRCIVEWEAEDIEEGDGDGEGEGEKDKNMKKKSYIWDWVDGSSGSERGPESGPEPEPEPESDSVAEAVEMWERRRRGAKLELVGGRMQWVEIRGFAPRRVRSIAD